jgi:hypothetical protein
MVFSTAVEPPTTNTKKTKCPDCGEQQTQYYGKETVDHSDATAVSNLPIPEEKTTVKLRFATATEPLY